MINKQQLKPKKNLPRNIRYGLMSPEIKILVKKLCEKYQLVSTEKEEIIFSLIEKFVAGELNKEALGRKIFQNFKFNNNKTIDFLEDFEKIIEELKRIGIKEVKEDLVVLKFKDLLQKFPEINRQNIGVALVFFPKENQGVEPFIENWIKDYQLRKNDEQENTILNVSDYLYNSKNAEQLDFQEKKELSIVLNIFEGNKITYYNTLFEEIDFEIIKLLEKTKKPKAKVNITKFESKPYHEADIKTVFKQTPAKKINRPETKTRKPEQQNVLDLNNYV